MDLLSEFNPVTYSGAMITIGISLTAIGLALLVTMAFLMRRKKEQ